MGRNRLLKKLRALLWALLACMSEVAVSDASTMPVRLFYKLDSQEVRNLAEGLKRSGRSEIILSNNISADSCNAPGEIITFGGDATEEFSKLCPQRAVTFLSSTYMYAKTRDMLPQGSWGYYLDQPISKQLDHVDRNIPSIKTIGILYNDRDGDLARLKAAAAANHRVQVRLVRVESGQIIAQVLRSLYEQVDAVMVTANSEIWPLQDFKTYLLLGMRQGKIMVGGHNQFFTNRGVISSINNDFTALGERIGKELTSGTHPQVRYFNKGVIVTNQMLAARYGIYIGDKKEE